MSEPRFVNPCLTGNGVEVIPESNVAPAVLSNLMSKSPVGFSTRYRRFRGYPSDGLVTNESTGSPLEFTKRSRMPN